MMSTTPAPTAHTRCAAHQEWPTTITVPTEPIAQPENIYLLTDVSYGAASYAGKPIGAITVKFADGRSLSYKLVLGENIRDWNIQSAGAVGTVTSPDVVEVYRGRTAGGILGVADMLTLYIPEAYSGGSVVSITIQDTSQETAGSDDPCIWVVGITARVRERL